MAEKKTKSTKSTKSAKAVKKTKDKVVKSIDINKDEIVLDIKEELKSKIKTQITKEMIDDIKNDISTLVKEDVRNDLKREIDKEIRNSSKRVLWGRRGKIFRRDIIIIILLAIIGYLLYYMYNHNYVSFSINSNMNNVAITNEKKVVSNKEDFSYLLDMVNVKLPLDNNNALYLYTGNYKEANINDSIKLTMAYNLLLSDSFTPDDIKSAYDKLFGTDKNFKNVSFDYECKKFKYDDASNTYSLINDECINTSNKEIIEKIINISNKKDKVVITTVMGIYDTSNKSLYNYKNVYTPIAVDLNNNFNIQDYQNKLDTYKYTFIKDNEEYHFDSISN